MADSDPAVVCARGAVTNGAMDCAPAKHPIPLPCITILIHGVNDVGEAYSAQEHGLCAGLNARLNRSHDVKGSAKGDLTPASYSASVPGENGKPNANPDAVDFRRAAADDTWSPIIPFYWGFREEEGEIIKNAYHGQWTDRFGNRLDKNGAKNGGPFANATSTLNDMWGPGFSGTVAGSETIAKKASTGAHNLVKAMPREYMILAAKRLAMLIKIIRSNNDYKDVAINVLCHSQGSMVTLAAHAFLAEDGGFAADTVIVQDPPYSIEEPVMEEMEIGKRQQTTQSRIETLKGIIGYIGSKRASSPPLSDLLSTQPKAYGVTGPFWKPGGGAQKENLVADKPYTFTERDNRGKFYLYFCPHDQTVSLMSVQGIGWQGIPDEIWVQDNSASKNSYAIGPMGAAPVMQKVPAFKVLDPATFRQRMFTSKARFDQSLAVGTAPGRKEVPVITGGATSTSKSVRFTNADSRYRTVNGEELVPPLIPDLTFNEMKDEPGKLKNSDVDAAIIVSGPGGIKTTSDIMTVPMNGDKVDTAALQARLPGQNPNKDAPNDDKLQVVSVQDAPVSAGEGYTPQPSNLKYVTYTTQTANQARAYWQSKGDDNSYHSAVPANSENAREVTAYDLSIGKPLPLGDDQKDYLAYLCAVADWRTDWSLIDQPQSEGAEKILKVKSKESTKGALQLIGGTFKYYKTGILPSEVKSGETLVKMPGLIANQTVGT